MLPQKRFDSKLFKFEKFRIKLAFFINEFFTKFSLFFGQPQFNLIEVKIAANTPTMIMIISFGWSSNTGFHDFFHKIFFVFQTATIQSYRSQDCCKYTNNDYDCNTNNVVIDDSVLCAGSTTQKIGVCFGDSGGPLIYFNGSHNLLGECREGSCVSSTFRRCTPVLNWSE